MKLNYKWYPLLLLIGLFVLDKIFILDFFHNEFIQSGNEVYYKHRRQLLNRLHKDSDLANKKLILIFGDSRAYAYANKGFTPDHQKKYTLYNFSAPQAVPAYSYNMLKRIIDSGIKPDFVLLALSPEGFNKNTNFMGNPFLKMGADREFIDTYWDKISLPNKKDYVLDKVFTFRSLDFQYKLLLERLKQKELNQYNPLMNKEFLILNLFNGESLAYTTFQNDEVKLKKDAERIKKIYLGNFQLGEEQFFYTEEFIKTASMKGIKTFVIWPGVYPGYRAAYLELGLKEKWWKRIQELGKKYDNNTININENNQCNSFYDASHQSSLCYWTELNSFIEIHKKDSNTP